MRADARRNRQRLLEVAETVFAEHGSNASTEAVAKAAGVGIGTVFRHFPTKEDLLREVYAEHLRRFAEQLAELAESTDPGTEFFAFCERFLEQARRKQAILQALTAAGIEVSGPDESAKQQLHESMDRFVRQAQQAGTIRTDVRGVDVLALLVGAVRADEQFGIDRKGLDVILDGLRV